MGAIQGALYFPLIRPEHGFWLTRALLYWDHVGTIVPTSSINTPELLGETTLDLVRRELLLQVFPDDVPSWYGERFATWLSDLDAGELRARRAALRSGDVEEIHADKWLRMGPALRRARELRLVSVTGAQSGRDWIQLESRTANEFMASLAVALCQTVIARGASGFPIPFLPATDRMECFRALTTQSKSVSEDRRADHQLMLRLEGERRIHEIRTTTLDRLLPVPEDLPTAEQLERFRRRHGDKLPAFRRDLEERIDASVRQGDEVLRQREVDRVAEQVEELIEEVEAYLKESGFRRLRRSSVLSLMQAVPGVGGSAAAVQGAAGKLESASYVGTKRLAYLAFARAELSLDRGDAGRIPPEPWLLEAFSTAPDG